MCVSSDVWCEVVICDGEDFGWVWEVVECICRFYMGE